MQNEYHFNQITLSCVVPKEIDRVQTQLKITIIKKTI